MASSWAVLQPIYFVFSGSQHYKEGYIESYMKIIKITLCIMRHVALEWVYMWLWWMRSVQSLDVIRWVHLEFGQISKRPSGSSCLELVALELTNRSKVRRIFVGLGQDDPWSGLTTWNRAMWVHYRGRAGLFQRRVPLSLMSHFKILVNKQMYNWNDAYCYDVD